MLKVDPTDKKKIIDPLFRTSRSFLIAVAALLVVFGFGVYMFMRQLTLGLGETGMDRPAYWGIYMANFIFFIGISHAGTLISAILRVTGAEWRRSITRIAEAITVFALVVGTLQIIIDMGRPDRLWFTLRYGRLQSPILWDIVSVTLYFLGSVAYLYLPLIPDAAIVRDNAPNSAPAWQKRLYSFLALGWRGNREQWLRLERAIGVMAVFIIPVAVSVHTIISWILATTVQPGWHSSIFGPYFVVGAIFSGIGALFIAMTAVRRALHLEDYITPRQYRNLGLLFIVMNVIWAYFTYAEYLGIAAAQQTDEFVVLASKLWGDFAPMFWLMIAVMIASFWVLVIPKVISRFPISERLARPQVALAMGGGVLVTAYLLFAPAIPWLPPLTTNVALTDTGTRIAMWALLIVFVLGFGLAIAPWLSSRPVAATVIASVFVLVGMWLERWNIVVPTVTQPRLIPYATNYTPTLTELSLSAASVALFVLLFLLFFKLFPAVSLWEVAEGRVIEEAKEQITIPEPEPNEVRRGLRWIQRL